jgi:tetratricopeptide (TPR) repeat protein
MAKARLGDLRGAIDDYTQAIKLKPDLTFAYYCRGLTEAKLGDIQAATADVRQALTKEAGSPIQEFSEAIEKHPADPDWYLARGLTFSVLKNKESALKDFETSVRLDPDLKRPLDRLLHN